MWGLRDIVIATILEHMSLLTKPEIDATMKDINGLAFDVLKLKVLQHGGEW